MKNTFSITALAAILGLALAGAPITAQAQTTPAPTTTPAATTPDTSTTAKVKEKKEHKKSDKTSYEGAVTAIDASSVTVTTTKKTLTLAIDAKTKFAILDGKKKTPATVTDFAVGDKVTGSYTVDAAGAMTAASVHKKGTAAAAPAAASTPAAQ